MTDVGSVSDQL